MSARGKRNQTRSRSRSPSVSKVRKHPSMTNSSQPVAANVKSSACAAASSQHANPNQDIIDMLLELGEYEKNINRRVYAFAAYRKAAAALQKLGKRLRSGDEARNLDGVGEKISKKIDEYLATGKLNQLDDVRQDEANNVAKELTRVSGIGPVFAAKLYQEGIRSLEDLHKHAVKLNQHQRLGLQYVFEFESRIPRAEMKQIEAVLHRELLDLDARHTVTICGSYRRGAETCSDVDVLITHPKCILDDPAESSFLMNRIVKRLKDVEFITDSISVGESKFMGVCKLTDSLLEKAVDAPMVACSSSEPQTSTSSSSSTSSNHNQSQPSQAEVGHSFQDQPERLVSLDQHHCQSPLEDGSKNINAQSVCSKATYIHRRIDIIMVPPVYYPCGLLHFTGSNIFNQYIRGLAHGLGYTLNEHSLRRLDSNGVPGKPLPVNSEEDVFDYLCIPYRKPEDRNAA